MSEGGTIRSLRDGGRVVGKTADLARTFVDAVTAPGPPCLIVGPKAELDRLRPHLPAWVETLSEEDTPRNIVYAFSMTLEEWKASAG